MTLEAPVRVLALSVRTTVVPDISGNADNASTQIYPSPFLTQLLLDFHSRWVTWSSQVRIFCVRPSLLGPQVLSSIS